MMRFGQGYGRWAFGGGGFGHDAHPGARGRHGGRRMFDGGELRLVLLKLIAEQPRHGYDLIRAVEEMTGGTYAPSPGVVYPTLTMLQDMGHIEEQASEGARKAFAVTAEGEAFLGGKADEVEALMERLRHAGGHGARHNAAPVKRAMGNLAAAVQHRVAGEDMTHDMVHDIAAIIDEAAQKIERL